MKKKIRQITGTSIGITFTKEEREIHDIKLGGVLDLSCVFECEEEIDMTDYGTPPSSMNILEETRKNEKKTKNTNRI